MAPGYDDAAWGSGLGVFYGLRGDPQPVSTPATLDGSPVNTYLNLFTNAANEIQQTNYYFRTTFTLPSTTTNGATLLVHSMIDDGAIFYLNGTRVGDVRYTTDPAYCTNFAASGGNQTWEPALAATGRVLGSAGLVPGQNTLAVQLAQNNGTSSDITFGVLLEAEVVEMAPQAPTLHWTADRTAGTVTFTWDDPTFQLVEADTVNQADWTPVLGQSNTGTPVQIGTVNKFYKLRK